MIFLHVFPSKDFISCPSFTILTRGDSLPQKKIRPNSFILCSTRFPYKCAPSLVGHARCVVTKRNVN